MPLTQAQATEALRRIAQWRIDPALPVACPVCDAAGLAIIDRSTRPYAEWYALDCKACGLAETLNVPMSAPIQSLD